LLHRWQGKTLMAIGAKDPVLGVPVMEALHAQIRNCAPPLVLPEAGHFVQEQGDAIAREAVGYFRP
jgi:tRNA(adenine34) deaminase